MPLETVDLVIEARWVLPIAPINTVLADHAVAIRDGRIVAVAPAAQLNARFQPAERVVRHEHALLPGLVNAHVRAATTLLRGLPVQGPLMRWLYEIVRPAEERCLGPDFVRDGTKLAIAEMLQAGITSFADMYLFPEEAARVASACRMHASIGLPVAETPNAWADSATGHLAKAEHLWDEYHSDPWVCLHFAPQDAADIGDDTLVRVRRIADELDARIAMRLHETGAEVQASLSVYGCRPLERLRQLGLLRPGFTAMRLNKVDDGDLEIVSETGIAAVACTQSDLRLGSGRCPVERLRARGVAVGLGTGDPVSVGALDVLSEARTTTLLASGTNGADEPLSSEEALYMATLGGANALGLGSTVGSLEPGKAADLICLDLSALASQPVLRAADSIVFGATRAAVSDVWTAGRPAVSNGRLLTLDEQELSFLARQWRERCGLAADGSVT